MQPGSLDRLMQRLTAAGVRFEVHDDAVIVPPTSTEGFAVRLTHSHSTFVVSYDGWSEHFSSEDQAISAFIFGLSDRCRLKLFRRNGHIYRWTVEHAVDGRWCESSTMGTCSFPLFQQRDIEYRQNALIAGFQPT